MKSLFELMGCLKGGECDWVPFAERTQKCTKCGATQYQLSEKEMKAWRKRDKEFEKWLRAVERERKESEKWLKKHPMVFKSVILTAPMQRKIKKAGVVQCVNLIKQGGLTNLKNKSEKRKRT